MYLFVKESAILALIRLLFLASLTADNAVLAETRSIDKMAITSLGSAFAVASSVTGSDEANAASAETSTPFFFFEVTIHIITRIRTITAQTIDAYNNTEYSSLNPGIFGIIPLNANYFCPL